MRIAMVTGVWRRPEVFEMFAKGVKHLGVDVDVIVAGSEGSRSRRMVEAKGFTYVEVPNQPLAAKMNATTMLAEGYDYVICMGSDDILSPELMKHYLKYMNEGFDFIGIEDCYFYDLRTKRAAYWGGYRERYRQGVTAGIGRCISKKLMEKWEWQPWEVSDSKYLDNSMQGRISGKQVTLNCKELGVYALDIKSVINMTPFKLWDNTSYIDAQIIRDNFKYLF